MTTTCEVTDVASRNQAEQAVKRGNWNTPVDPGIDTRQLARDPISGLILLHEDGSVLLCQVCGVADWQATTLMCDTVRPPRLASIHAPVRGHSRQPSALSRAV